MNQVAFNLFGMEVHWYGLMIALGIALAVVLACFLAKYRNLTKDDILELLIWVLPPAIIGARLYYLIFNGGPWGWESFAIWNGGLAVYGSIIGGAIGVILYCVVRKKNFLDVADVVAPALALGQCIGRIGCYFGGCCYGVETTNQAFQFFPMSVIIDGNWHLATFFYESFFCLLICVALSAGMVIFSKKIKTKGLMLGGYMVLYGILRAILEGLRDDPAALFIGSYKVSQLLSYIIIVGGVVLIVLQIVKTLKLKPKKVGLK